MPFSRRMVHHQSWCTTPCSRVLCHYAARLSATSDCLFDFCTCQGQTWVLMRAVLSAYGIGRKDAFDHDNGQKSAISGRRLLCIFLWIFCFFSRFGVQFRKKIAPKCGEKCPISRQRKKRGILSRLWLFFFVWSREVVSQGLETNRKVWSASEKWAFQKGPFSSHFLEILEILSSQQEEIHAHSFKRRQEGGS